MESNPEPIYAANPRRLGWIEFFSNWFRQMGIMIRRNTILQIRSKKTTLAQILIGPLLFLFLLFILQKSDNARQSRSDYHPTAYPLEGVSKCQRGLNDAPCITMLFTPDTSEVRQIMNLFAANNEQRTGKQLVVESSSIALEDKPTDDRAIVPVQDANFIYNYTLRHPNITLYGLEFSTVDGPPKNYRYQVWFNSSLSSNSSTGLFNNEIVSLIRGLDEAIIAVANDPNAQPQSSLLDVQLKDWPRVPPTQLADDVIAQFGAMFFFCTEMIIFMSVLNTIVTEKELGLREMMEQMGLRSEVYWISWLLNNALIVAICALVTVVFGIIFRFDVFVNTNFFVSFLAFFLFGLAMVSFAFFMTTFIRQSRPAVFVGIFFFIIGLLFQSFVFSNSFIGYIWWDKGTDPAGWMVLIFLPFFNFGKLFLDMNVLTTGRLDILTDTFIPGPGFYWSNLYETIPKQYLPTYGGEGDYRQPAVPQPIQSMYFMLMNIGLYLVLTWYFDKVVPSASGKRRAPWFFLTPSYWGFRRQKFTSLEGWLNSVTTKTIEGEDVDVTEERKRVMDPKEDMSVRIVGLHKVYRNSWFRKSKDDKVAVKDLSLGLKQGSLLALLGQNGAGKSTSMSMLAGTLPVSGGDAWFYGRSLQNDVQEIRGMLGLCPQHDVLFNEMSAQEHIELYAGLKGIPKVEIPQLVEDRLKAVRLWTVKDRPAGSYSGGMKRRLSVIISTISDPAVVFLDEPTTGMDPVNRRHVWSFLEEFKKDRVIILTTHSMEEADVLGDQICVMAHGELRAIGSSIRLKNKFGAGYRITVVTTPEEANSVQADVESRVPGCVLEDSSAGSLIFQFPLAVMSKIPSFVKYLETNENPKIKAWGISQTTLEEVFLKLIREANPSKKRTGSMLIKNEATDEFASDGEATSEFKPAPLVA